MKTHTTGILIDGVVQLDEPVDLPNNSRVAVIIQPEAIDPAKSQSAFESFKKRAEQRSFNSRGLHFTRDELHERR